MALNVPDVGENKMLEAIVNKTAPENLSLRLFVNNITPADTDTAATYTVATFSGYANITLAGASWNAAAGGSIAYSAQQEFTANANGQTDDVYGYYLVQVTSGVLMWSERDAAAPFAIRNNGDKVQLTPVITAN